MMIDVGKVYTFDPEYFLFYGNIKSGVLNENANPDGISLLFEDGKMAIWSLKELDDRRGVSSKFLGPIKPNKDGKLKLLSFESDHDDEGSRIDDFLIIDFKKGVFERWSIPKKKGYPATLSHEGFIVKSGDINVNEL